MEYEKEIVTEESKKAMSEVLAEAEKKTASDYTEDSWKAYQIAVEVAKALAEKEDATNAEYQKAIQAVRNAEIALQKVDTPSPEPTPSPGTDTKSGADTKSRADTKSGTNGREESRFCSAHKNELYIQWKDTETRSYCKRQQW